MVEFPHLKENHTDRFPLAHTQALANSDLPSRNPIPEDGEDLLPRGSDDGASTVPPCPSTRGWNCSDLCTRPIQQP
ncbi:hypothetical protein AAC387_Pa08g1553 [Persea americana]